MSRKFIPKIEKTLRSEKVGWFFMENDKGQKEVFFAVPKLDGIGRLMGHSIAYHGGVEPSVLITGVDEAGGPIEYHEFVTLQDWPNDFHKPAGDQFISPVSP